MLEFILMLFGLAFPSTDANTVNNGDQTQIVNVQTQTTDTTPNDTGGETQPIPPKK